MGYGERSLGLGGQSVSHTFVSGCNFGLLLINPCKELPYIGNQEIGLLQSRKVSALRHASFLYYVVCLSNPAKRRDSHILRKIRIPHRSLQVWRRHHLLYGEPVLTINSHGGADRAGRPIERNIG